MSEFKINLAEEFTHLRNAPIREALIDFRARARIPWDAETLRSALQPKLPDYPTVVVQNSMIVGFMVKPHSATAETKHEQSWKGLQFRSSDGIRVARFDRDGFTFSRLAPYQDWNDLQNEMLRLWEIHVKAADPDKIVRIGLRFINRIDLPLTTVEMQDYIPSFPKQPLGLEKLNQASFLHIDNFQVPNYGYAINVTKTLERGVPDKAGVVNSWGVILDIDVATGANIEINDVAQIKTKLAEMRWLKNKVFFGSISDNCKNGYL
jgi:uncharacterized protein (TIGR04255 family)